jgi:hypothetical protein
VNRIHRHGRRALPAAALTAALAGALAVGLPPATAAASEADQAGQGSPAQVTSAIQVVVDGLDTPRGLIYDADTDRILIAEAGTGGPALQAGGICGHANGNALYCYGATGAVFQYPLAGGPAPGRIITGLPSIANYNSTGTVKRSVLGLHDLSQRPQGQLRGVFGLSGAQPFRDTELVGGGAVGADALGTAVRFLGHSGTMEIEGDLVAFEQQHNPQHVPLNIIDSDPYGMVDTAEGTVVADAAGNDILLVRPDGGIDVLAVLPDRDLPQFNDFIEPVPTTITVGPDSALYFGELSGFPYYKGQAKVWRLVPGEQPTLVAEGFTNIADLTFDDLGRLVVLEMSGEGLFAGAPNHNGDTVTGRLVRVEADGSQTDLATTGLQNPGGVVYTGGGVYYVTNRTTSVGGNGQLLRIDVQG